MAGKRHRAGALCVPQALRRLSRSGMAFMPIVVPRLDLDFYIAPKFRNGIEKAIQGKPSKVAAKDLGQIRLSNANHAGGGSLG
jgi:hypothetical protein